MGIETTTREHPKDFLTVAGTDLHMFLPVLPEAESKNPFILMFKEVASLKPLIEAINQQSTLKLQSIEATAADKSPTISGFKEPKGTLLS